MSSKYVRDQITSFITTNLPTETQVDLAGEFENLKDMLAHFSINPRDPWLGVQYVGEAEIPVTIDADNVHGKYRELGIVFLHIVEVAKLGVAANIINRAEEIRTQFRGQRIGDLVIQSVGVPNFSSGATLQFEGGYTSAAVTIEYRRDFNI